MTDSTRKKLIVFTFAAGMSLGLLFTGISFAFWQRSNGKNALFYSTATQAKMVSSNVKCSLSFNDRKDANSILDSLKTQTYVAFAGIYDSEGRLFAYYYRNGIDRQNIVPTPPSKVKFKYQNGFLVVSEPIIEDHQLIGTVCIWAQQ